MSEFKPKKVEKFKHKDGEIIVEYFLDLKDLKKFGIETINVEQQIDDITFNYACPIFRSKNNNGLEVGLHDEKSFIVNIENGGCLIKEDWKRAFSLGYKPAMDTLKKYL